MLRAVIDANVLISAFIRPESPPGQIIHRWLEYGDFALVVAPAILAEAKSALEYPRVARYLKLSTEEIEALLALVEIQADVVEELPEVRAVPQDPDDDMYIATALEGRADFIVTGDRHLLEIGEYEHVRIVTPRAFLDFLRPQTP